MPDVYMIAGPNGAGKTTAAKTLLREFFHTNEFVNADEIARGLSPYNAEGQAILAGRLMIKRIEDLIASGKSFAFETTGASNLFVKVIHAAKLKGYQFRLLFFWLPDPAVSIERVRYRVIQGGHHVPEDDIRRRYRRGLANLVRRYLPLADRAAVYDSAGPLDVDHPSLIMEKLADKLVVYQEEIWHNMQIDGAKDEDQD